MATPSRQLDRIAVQEQLLAICRGLLAELGSLQARAAVRADSRLDRDLGLGSLERIELMLRLDSVFGTRLPDRAVAEANTVADLVAAVVDALKALPTGIEAEYAAREAPAAGSSDRGVEDRERATTSAGRAPRSLEASVESAGTLQEVLRYRARADANRPHIHLRDADGLTTTITFGELYNRAACVARELARRGLEPGDAVAIMLPTSREFFFAFAGVLLAGAIPVPIYPPFRADRIEEYAARQSTILKNAEARLLIIPQSGTMAAVARLLRPRVPSLKDVVSASRLLEQSSGALSASSEDLAPHPARGDDIALLQYTSGSTGEPKGVVLTHANLLANVRAIVEAVEVRSDDVTVTWLPLYHDMGLIGTWLMPLYAGLPVAVLPPLAFLSHPERWLWAAHHHRATLGAAPNFAFELCVRKIADRNIEGLDLSSWRALLNGAEPVNPETLDRFAARFARYGLRREALLPVYGLAEAALALTIPPPSRAPRVDRIERAAFERDGRALPIRGDPAQSKSSAPDDAGVISFVSMGRPVPGHGVRIVDASGRDVGERVEGALWFRGPSATRGYYRNAPATRALFPQGERGALGPAGPPWLDSGDRAYRADGEIYVTGRVKDIIIKAGRNIYAHEVEELAGRVDGVRKGCVVAFGVRDAVAGTERLVVVAEARERDPAQRTRIVGAIRAQVAAALGLPPDVVELAPPQSIPKTSSGKLRREETKKLYLSGTLAARKPPAWFQVVRLGGLAAAQAIARRVRRALEVMYGVYAAVVFGAWIVPAWLVVLMAPGRRFAAWVTSNALRLYMALVGCRIRVVGREHLDGRAARLYVANHTSYFDVLALMAALGVDYRFVAKIEVRSMPFIRTWMRRLGHFAFDRGDPQARLRQAEEIEQTLRRGESVFVFPEGTFTRERGVRPFQLGAFKAAVATGRPIYPVALRGTRRFLPDETYLPRPTSVTLTICPPLHPAPTTSPSDWHEMVRLRDAARAVIARHCGEELL